MNIWPWNSTNICSLNEYISLNGYNFPEWICFPWTRMYFLEWTDKFLEMNIIPRKNTLNCLEWLYLLWINICSLNEFISLSVNKYVISLKLNKYNSMKLHRNTVAGCKIMHWVQIYFVECEYMYFLIFTNHSQLLVVTQTDTNCDLLVLCIPCEQRPLVYHEKQKPIVLPRQIRHYLWNLLFR